MPLIFILVLYLVSCTGKSNKNNQEINLKDFMIPDTAFKKFEFKYSVNNIEKYRISISYANELDGNKVILNRVYHDSLDRVFKTRKYEVNKSYLKILEANNFFYSNGLKEKKKVVLTGDEVVYSLTGVTKSGMEYEIPSSKMRKEWTTIDTMYFDSFRYNGIGSDKCIVFEGTRYMKEYALIEGQYQKTGSFKFKTKKVFSKTIGLVSASNSNFGNISKLEFVKIIE
ncbi:MAG: hypothetical protein AB8B72_05180 [Crocinitomicaceae bacterium]